MINQFANTNDNYLSINSFTSQVNGTLMVQNKDTSFEFQRKFGRFVQREPVLTQKHSETNLVLHVPKSHANADSRALTKRNVSEGCSLGAVLFAKTLWIVIIWVGVVLWITMNCKNRDVDFGTRIQNYFGAGNLISGTAFTIDNS